MHTVESIKAAARTGVIKCATGFTTHGVELFIVGVRVVCLCVRSSDPKYDQYTFYVGGPESVARDEAFIQRLLDRQHPPQYAADAPWRQVKGGIIR
jgi:hypothetical protein